MLPGIGTPVRASGRSAEIWCLEWTYSDGSGAVSLDTTNSDRHPDIASPVVDSGTAGQTDITFPKCTRARVLHCSIETPTADTAEQIARVGDIDADAGTCTFIVLSDAFALEEATSGSRGRLTLLLDRP